MNKETTNRRGTCPICGSDRWEDFLATTTGRIMTGDQRVMPGQLWKVRCRGCGVVANGRSFGEEELAKLYGQEYQLNTGGHEEHLFFTSSGPIPRSRLFLDRIAPHLPPRCQSLLEIGCGEGNLLKRFVDLLPDARIRGIDGSECAVELARARGLDVTQALVSRDVDLPSSDVIVCLSVLEHVEDVAGFLGTIRRSVNPRGRVIFSLPVQDNLSYDVFFHEHVWHFDVGHTTELLTNNGLKVVARDCNHPVNELMGLFFCEPVVEGGEAPVFRPSFEAEPSYAAVRNRDAWTRVFGEVNTWLASKRPRRLAVFGAGEVFALFWALTSLPDWPVVACLDDDPNKIGSTRQGIRVCPTRWVMDNRVDAVLMAVNPKYQPVLSHRLASYVDEVFTWTAQPVKEALEQPC